MLLFAISIFLSAFLLFQVQPMIGKFILPWFGGTPAVWSTLMLFFQVLLTGGYAYADWLVAHLPPRRQFIVHVTLIVAAVLTLFWLSMVWPSPITPDSSWKPVDVTSPVLDIFTLLFISVGLPYFVLAANNPLMQAWFSRFFPGRSYARLYALSNAGSLLGLLAYPMWIEAALPLRSQGWMWAVSFVAFGGLAGWIAGIQRGKSVTPALSEINGDPGEPNSAEARPSMAMIMLWIALSATASLFLLSATNQITQEVAVLPVLWVLPLTVYLISFILTFSDEQIYHRTFYAILFGIFTLLTLFVMLNITILHVYWQIIVYCILLFTVCMLCHGELYTLRPASKHLTLFYLMISIGGALGGLFVNLIAPLLFNGYWEFFLGLTMAVAILLPVLRRNRTPHLFDRARFVFSVFTLVTVMLAVLSRYFSGVLFSERNFYGVIRVHELVPAGATTQAYVMSHGIILHGLQFIDAQSRQLPTTYYVPESGTGLAILNHPKYGHRPMRIGLLGLGVGTLVTYGHPGDEYRVYEINPIVLELAQGQGNYFSFLSNSQADVISVLGDARISLERELVNGEVQGFDILVLDTFSSGAIPVHLLTKEAFALYLAHLSSEGIIAAHITNLHLDLQPVFWKLADYYDLSMVRIDYLGDSNGGFVSHWILLSRDPALLRIPAIQEHAVNLSGYSTDINMWTDDYSNLFQILK
jgi:hypothetical protein